MKRVTLSLAAFVLLAAFSVPALAQEEKDKAEKTKSEKLKEKKEVEQIIITRKSGTDEKIVVEVNGDKITVNGKPIEEFKDGDVKVHRNKMRNYGATVIAPGQWEADFDLDMHNGFMFDTDADHAMLGVVTEKVNEGAEINEITKESGAEKAGLKVGDIITKVDEKKIVTPDDLSRAIREHKPGDKVAISFIRDKKDQKVTAELGKWKGAKAMTLPRFEAMPKMTNPPSGFAWSMGGGPKLGLSVQDTDDGKGVKVLEVDRDGNAAKAGLKEGDIITHVNDTEITGADQVAKLVRENKDKVSINVKVKRDGKTQNIEVKIPRKLKTADL